MTLKQMIVKKVTSRKFWIAAAAFIAGMAMAFRQSNNKWLQLAGVVMSCLSALVYLIIEGRIDARAVSDTVAEMLRSLEKEETK